MAEYRAGEFATIPNVHLISQLSHSELTVFVYLCWRAGKDKSCFPSYSLMEKDAGVSRRTAISAINNLEALGWIKRQSRERANGSHSSNVYRIMQVKGSGGSAKDAPPSAKKDTGGSAKKNTPLTITSKNNNQLTTTNVVELKAHGNEEINLIVTGFNKTFNVDHNQDRRYAQHFRRKFGVEVTLAMFAKAAEAQSFDKYCPRTPTLKDFWYQIPKLQDYFRRKQQQSGMTEINF